MWRVDFNVPLDGTTITNNQRIVSALPTIKYALEKGKLKELCFKLKNNNVCVCIYLAIMYIDSLKPIFTQQNIILWLLILILILILVLILFSKSFFLLFLILYCFFSNRCEERGSHVSSWQTRWKFHSRVFACPCGRRTEEIVGKASEGFFSIMFYLLV